jgi:ATP-dependent RNA helicase DeaD
MPFPSTAAPLANALAARGYEESTPVQTAILQTMALGRALLVSAQTGWKAHLCENVR